MQTSRSKFQYVSTIVMLVIIGTMFVLYAVAGLRLPMDVEQLREIRMYQWGAWITFGILMGFICIRWEILREMYYWFAQKMLS